MDGLIVLSAMLVFGVEQGLYAMLGVFISSKTIDVVQVGFNRSKMALIITRMKKPSDRLCLKKSTGA